jgi:hypothetical protein
VASLVREGRAALGLVESLADDDPLLHVTREAPPAGRELLGELDRPVLEVADETPWVVASVVADGTSIKHAANLGPATDRVIRTP